MNWAECISHSVCVILSLLFGITNIWDWYYGKKFIQWIAKLILLYFRLIKAYDVWNIYAKAYLMQLISIITAPYNLTNVIVLNA